MTRHPGDAPPSRHEVARLEAENARLRELVACLRHDLAQVRAQCWQEMPRHPSERA